MTPAREPPSPPLAELHLHLYGAIRAEHYLDFVRNRVVDWRFYEHQFEKAYDAQPPVREVLERHRDGDPAAARDFKRLFVFGDEDAGNFERFQAKFNLLINGSEFMNLGDPEAPLEALLAEIRHFVHAILEDQRRDGIGYAEQRVLLGFDRERCRRIYGDILGEYRAETRDGMIPRLAVSLPRDDPWPQWEVVQELALGPDGESLTGIDFCYVEEGHPPKEKAEFFSSVRDFNERHPERALAILYHVGESFTDKSLESAIRWVQEAAELGAHRLGHAIALGVEPESFGPHERSESIAERRDQLAYDLEHAKALSRNGVPVDEGAARQELEALRGRQPDERLAISYDAARLAEVRARQEYAMERVRASGAVIEVCPTSNRRIGSIDDPEHHPVHRFIERDLPFTVSSDDPGIFDTSIRKEIEWVVRAADLDPESGFADLAARSWRYRSEVVSGRLRSRV